VYKVLTTIMEHQIMDYVEDNNILGECQGAFRRGRRCEDHIFVLKGICSLRKSRKKRTYLAFLDISKAFDTVDRAMLFNTLWDRGIQGKAWRLVRMLYNRVDNKVIFGSFESDMYQVANGVKQGCVLSPTLFNLVVVDLDIQINGCGGINTGLTSVNGLYYADDIVLFANCENDLVKMLATADNFAKKWGLKFNSKKSQVLVVGKRVSNRLWPLGDVMLTEVQSYKYLGVYINRFMKDNNHIKQHLETKGKKFEAHLRFILANHMDINRVNFGSTMWTKALLPGLAHASGIWFNETKSSQTCLRSVQYKCAKAVLKLHCMPSQTATIGELGWTPIIDHLDNLRVSYFNHLKNMDNHRLTKQIFNEMLTLHSNNVPTCFQYFGNIKSIFAQRGVDHLFNTDINMDSSNVITFKQFNLMHRIVNTHQEMDNYSSLKHYRFLKQNTHCSDYLYSDHNFKSVQLKFKLRTGVLGIGEDFVRQKRGPGYCKGCGAFESLKHFILYCPAYLKERQIMLLNVRKETDDETFSTFIQHADVMLSYLLGDHDDVFNKMFLTFLHKIWLKRKEF
jgi:hypothetical protein